MSRDIVVATFGSLLLATLVGGCDSGIGQEQAADQAPERRLERRRGKTATNTAHAARIATHHFGCSTREH